MSLVRTEPQACEKRGTRRQDKAIGLWSWLWCPGLTALRRAMKRPRARRPSARTTTGRLPTPPIVLRPASISYATQGQAVAVGFAVRGPDRRVGCGRGVWSLAGRGGSSRLRLASVSVAPLVVPPWGVVQHGERHWRACRCSRGRRPSGSDSEATAPLAALPQRHPSEAGGRLTRTRLRRACRLQRPCSLPTCLCFRGKSASAHRSQRPVPDATARALPERACSRSGLDRSAACLPFTVAGPVDFVGIGSVDDCVRPQIPRGERRRDVVRGARRGCQRRILLA